jgi:hypothetical protein
MEIENKSTTPKPFVFVLMPFNPKFDDIYKFGIKGAAEEAGAYAERVDEQIFTEGFLDRVFNQINKADVIVADMTGGNPNVFYEVGYAHALGKIVLLLIKDTSDIPSDLRHRPHIVYEGSIEKLKASLLQKISWAINETTRTQALSHESPFEISVNGTLIPIGNLPEEAPLAVHLLSNDKGQVVEVIVRNTSPEMTKSVDYIYLFSSDQSVLELKGMTNDARFVLPQIPAHASDMTDGLSQQYHLPNQIPALPPGTLNILRFWISVSSNNLESEGEELMRMQLHTSHKTYLGRLRVAYPKKQPE